VLALYIVAGVILIGIFMLSIPIEMAFDFDVHEQVRSRMRVGWFFGLIWKDIGRRRKKLEDKRKPEKKKRKKGIKPLLSLFRTEGVAGRLSKLVRKILSCLRIRQLDANLRIGLDDPADTAILCSMVWPVLAFHNPSSSASVVMEPSFDKPVFEGSVYGRIRLFPIQVIGPILQFVLSPTGLRVVKKVVSSRWN